MNPIIIYKGPSRFDGKPIVGVIKPTSNNNKTGNVATLWVVPADIDPTSAVRSADEDRRICGDCALRRPNREDPTTPRCYAHQTVVHKGAMSMFGSLPRRFDASDWDAKELANWFKMAKTVLGISVLRSAAWGDIAALPLERRELLNTARRTARLGTRGYTHQWRDPSCSDLRSWHMASIHKMEDYAIAKAAGWRVFFTAPWSGALPYNPDWYLAARRPERALLCPASQQAGYLTTCNSCTLCSGHERGETAPDVWIPDHGANVNARQNAIRRTRAAAELGIGKKQLPRVEALLRVP